MSITFVDSPAWEVGAGTTTTSVDVGTNPDALLAMFSATGSWPGAISIGGVALPFIANERILGEWVCIYGKLDPGPMSGMQDMVLVNTYDWTGKYVKPYAVSSSVGVLTIADIASGGWAGVGGSISMTSTENAMAFLVKKNQVGDNAIAGTTQDETLGVGAWAHETVAAVGTRTVGWTTNGLCTVLGVMLQEQSLTLTQAAPFEIEIEMPAGGSVASPDKLLGQVAPFTLEVEFPRPRLYTPRDRQLLLVGDVHTPDRLDPPEGMANPVLSWDGRKPVWIDLEGAHSRLVPLTTIGASGDPELVWTDDGDLVFTEYWD